MIKNAPFFKNVGKNKSPGAGLGVGRGRGGGGPGGGFGGGGGGGGGGPGAMRMLPFSHPISSDLISDNATFPVFDYVCKFVCGM